MFELILIMIMCFYLGRVETCVTSVIVVLELLCRAGPLFFATRGEIKNFMPLYIKNLENQKYSKFYNQTINTIQTKPTKII